jgi:hypothetical protein
MAVCVQNSGTSTPRQSVRLRKEVADIETDVSSLIEDMNRSIKEADAFVKAI